jgi:acetyl esterase/lipase
MIGAPRAKERPLGYELDPELAAAVHLMHEISLADDPVLGRALKRRQWEESGEVVDVSDLQVEDREVPGALGAPPVHVRVYTPDHVERPSAALLNVHGGAFISGDLDMDHEAAAYLASHLGVVVVSVGYRLAPEFPYPAALDDCYSALAWTHANALELGIDAERIGAFGQSAGACLVAALALLARDRGGAALAFQALGVPAIDDRLETPSMRDLVDTPQASRRAGEVSWRCYLGDRDPGDVPAYAAPSRATDLACLPPAYISVAEFDPLRDEGILYAVSLLQAGVAVELHVYPGTFHGSEWTVPTAAVSQRMRGDLLDALRRALRVHTSEFGMR